MSQCECAEIMATDPARHFRGCPMREKYPTHEAEKSDRPRRDYAIDWSKYPKLANIFEHRPTENIYWDELRDLIAEQVGDALQEHLTHCSSDKK